MTTFQKVQRSPISYEGFHQKVKRITKGARTGIDPCKRVMKFWCYQFAFLNACSDPSERKRLQGLA